MVDYVSLLNSCIRSMRSIPGLDVYRRDSKSGDPQAVKAAAEKWSEANGLDFPVSLLEMFSAMESDGISFVGRVSRPLCEGEPSTSFPGQREENALSKVSVCQCHINSVADIVEVVDEHNSSPCSFVGGRFFLLCSSLEGKGGKNVDSAGIDILIRFESTASKLSFGSPVEVWGQLIGCGPESRFLIANTFDDYMRLGCKRYCWVRGWQSLFLPPQSPDDASPSRSGLFAQQESMAPWLALLQE